VPGYDPRLIRVGEVHDIVDQLLDRWLLHNDRNGAAALFPDTAFQSHSWFDDPCDHFIDEVDRGDITKGRRALLQFLDDVPRPCNNSTVGSALVTLPANEFVQDGYKVLNPDGSDSYVLIAELYGDITMPCRIGGWIQRLYPAGRPVTVIGIIHSCKGKTPLYVPFFVVLVQDNDSTHLFQMGRLCPERS